MLAVLNGRAAVLCLLLPVRRLAGPWLAPLLERWRSPPPPGAVPRPPQAVAAAQLFVDEMLAPLLTLSPLKVLGCQGLLGVALTAGLAGPLVGLLPAAANQLAAGGGGGGAAVAAAAAAAGRQLEAEWVDTFAQMGGSRLLVVLLALQLLSFQGFNLCGMLIAGESGRIWVGVGGGGGAAPFLLGSCTGRPLCSHTTGHPAWTCGNDLLPACHSVPTRPRSPPPSGPAVCCCSHGHPHNSPAVGAHAAGVGAGAAAALHAPQPPDSGGRAAVLVEPPAGELVVAATSGWPLLATRDDIRHCACAHAGSLIAGSHTHPWADDTS